MLSVSKYVLLVRMVSVPCSKMAGTITQEMHAVWPLMLKMKQLLQSVNSILRLYFSEYDLPELLLK